MNASPHDPLYEPLIYELGAPGRTAVTMPAAPFPPAPLPPDLLRDELNLPEVSEADVVRHYTRLSRQNFGVDTTMYPLGSCTMKYNPRLNEAMAHLPGFLEAHPLQDAATIQGSLHMMFDLQTWLSELNGFTATSLQPAAGAQGEFTGILMVRAYHRNRGDNARDTILLPDSAHGTNPATSSMAGFKVVELPTDARGNVAMDALQANLGPHVAAMMITIPNTLGLFEENILEITQLVHACGGLMYADGANMNALMGIVKLADLGFDVMHYNLHKTFSTPHGGGGPGAGPVAANEKLAPFLPGPLVTLDETASPPTYAFAMPAQSIGRMKAFHGNFGILVRAYAYLRAHGSAELRAVSENAVLNANYLRVKIGQVYEIPYDRVCMHEFVAEGKLAAEGIRALDISKRLIDYGFHPPSNYFPLGAPHTTLKVHEALMVEPTETESRQTLDRYAAAMIAIRQEAQEEPELLHGAPHNAPVGRVDEVYAAKNLVLCRAVPE
ncbi:MAG: aminomethyl-transferring glycine dehydrogenase subunit GcvPB [Anaerolineae bacterium]|nr:aminomethyl-transferring glycine dehydrogenase subunit GcvPB [Anaerolineae bacterium]